MLFHVEKLLPKLGRHKHPLDRIAEFNGIISGVALFPQVIKSIGHGSVAGLSIPTFIFIFINSVIWILYARHRSLPQLLISSTLNCAAAASLLVLIFIHLAI